MISAAILASLAFLPADVAFAEAPQELRAPVIDVGALLPPAESVVPLNGQLVFIGAGNATFVRVRTDETGALVEEEPLDDHSILAVDQFEVAHVVGLPSSLGLTVGEQLVVQSRCASGCTFQGTWTVVDEDTTAPTFNDGPALITAREIGSAVGGTSGGYFVTVELPGARDDSSLTTIELRGDLTHLTPQAFQPGVPMNIFFETLDDTERTACFEAFAIDAAGNETAFRDELCVDLVQPIIGGCAQTTPATSSLGALLLLALALLRTRARRA